MPRARKPLTPSLKQLHLNTSTGFYEAEENGIIYHLTFTQMNGLKAFYFGNNAYNATFERWYNNLDRFAKKEIMRTGKLPAGDSGFYPDE